MRKNKAFSLPEVIIALTIVAIIGAGTLVLFSTGNRVALRGTNLNFKLTAERFSLDNINTQLQRGIVSIDVISIAAAKAIPPISADNPLHVIYRENTGPNAGNIILRSNAGDRVLSREKIKELMFELSSADDSLSVEVTARGIAESNSRNYKQVGVEVPLIRERIALLGPPIKGLSSPDEAIVFIPANDLVVYNLRILDLDTGDTLNEDKAMKDTNLLASFDTYWPDKSGGSGVDVSTIVWHVADDSDLSKFTGGDYNRLISFSLPIHSQTHTTSSGVTYNGDVLRTGDEDQQFRIFGPGSPEYVPPTGRAYVRYRLEPQINAGSSVLTHKTMWSPWVEITFGKPDGKGGGREAYRRFRNVFADANLAVGADNMHGGKWANGDAQLIDGGVTFYDYNRRADISTQNLATDEVMTGIVKSQGSAKTAIGAYQRMDEVFFEDAVLHEIAYGGDRNTGGKLDPYTGVAFTNAANYSIIVDAMLAIDSRFDNPTGVSIPSEGNTFVFNSTVAPGGNNNGAVINGHAFAYNYLRSSWGTSTQGTLSILRFPNNSDPTSTLAPPSPTGNRQRHGLDSSRLYNPGDMRNSKFPSFAGDAGSWRARRRIMYTVLEYLDTTSNTLRFIVRAKFVDPLGGSLKKLTDAEKNHDYFFIGPTFHFSEPIWFGGFVGSKTNGSNLTVFNYNNASGRDISVVAADNLPGLSMYGVGGWSPDIGSPLSAAFGNRPMNGTSNAIGRTRYWGFQTIVQNNANHGFTMYSFLVAPGFTPTELRAILPDKARLLTPGEVYGTPKLNYYDEDDCPSVVRTRANTGSGSSIKNPNLNYVLFTDPPPYVSHGDGNLLSPPTYPDTIGVNEIQYPRFKPYYLRDGDLSN